MPIHEVSQGAKPAVVAIGSSAGGLEALRAFLPFLPARSKFTFIVAQHLAPQHKSILSELLARDTVLPVEEIRDGSGYEPDKIYVTPPGSNVRVHQGRLMLTATAERGPKPSVDQLFESVAAECNHRGIAVVLSGSGSDGSRGVRTIKNMGGIVLAQDPSTAKYTGMPQSAIDTGCVDDCLAPKEIALRLQSLAGSDDPGGEPVHQHSRDVDQVLELLRARTGVDFRGYKPKTINRRIAQRMAANRVSSVSDYLSVLRSDASEAEKLGRSCLISVTSFFRDTDAFEALRASLEKLSTNDMPLRIWVPGCATGEEAYGIAMILDDQLRGRRFQIFGTDLDEDAIATARKATYTEDQAGQIPERFREAYLRQARPAFQIDRRLRDRVVFSRHDIVRDPLFLNLDIVSCRNLLIYLRAPAQQEVMRKFHYALKPAGLLFLGRSENAPPELFDTVSRRHKIFSNRALVPGSRRMPEVHEWSMPAEGSRRGSPVELASTGDLLRRALMDRFTPPSVLVDGDLNIIDSSGPVDRYLTIKAGRPETTITALVPKEISASLRAQLYRCRRTKQPSKGVYRNIESGGRKMTVRTQVDPLYQETTDHTLFLITFFESTGAGEFLITTAEPTNDDQVGELVRELNATRESLQAVVEELETSNEELQSLNEERQAANEELQASNEEMQATNEELQSTNEELVTVNEELENKSIELSAAVEDLESIHNNLDCPLVVLNGSGRIRLLNQMAFRYLGLNQSSVGGPLIIPGAAALSSGLGSRIEKVLHGEAVSDLKARLGTRHYAIRILGQMGRDGEIRGALVMFVDISDLARSAERLRVTIDSIPAHVAILDSTGKIVVVNAAWRRFGQENGLKDHRYSIGRNYLLVCDECFSGEKQGRSPVAEGIAKVLSGEIETFSFDYPCHSPTTRRWFKLLVTPVLDPRGRGAVVMHVDITDQILLFEKVSRQATALQSAANAIFITDSDGKIDWVNESFTRLSGYSLQELAGQTPAVLEVPGKGPQFVEMLKVCAANGLTNRSEVTQLAKPGNEYTVSQTITPIPSTSGELSHFVVIQEDITPHKNAEAKIVYLAEHDELTGLWNRKTFNDRLAEAISRQGMLGGRVAVLFLDLDRFKDTNDTMGHLVGDQMLTEVARRLKNNLREKDALARFGGDEFVIFLEKISDRDSVSFVVERILHSFTRPVEVDGRSVFVTASIGITFFPDDGVTAEELLRNADLAMYRAKSEGRRGYRFFDQKLESEINERVAVERELNRAIANRDLWIAFQPQWNIATGEVVGAEALLRWNAGREYNLPMGRVVAIAEECGLILPIGQWVIKESVNQLGRWHQRGRQIRVSVNLSAVQFHQQDVFGIITESMKSHGLAPGSLKAEITESVLLNRSNRVREALHALHGAGIGLVLDDFGTGYSSLSYLQQFPIETVKIDASFLQGVGKNRNDEAIVSGIIKMAHSLGQSVVAEGVETEEQMQFLRAEGCDFAQGFLFSRPLPAAEFDEFLESGATIC